MKKIRLLSMLLCSYALMLLLAGCANGASGKGTGGTPPAKPGILDTVVQYAFDDLSPADKTEVESLYGYYWADNGSRNECPAINADRIAVYNAGNKEMSVGFTKVRWGKLSASKWVCFAYVQDETDYVPSQRRFIFVFEKNDGTVKVWDTIVLMNGTFGPYTKGKEPETVQEGSTTYYRYDAGSPKLHEPTLK